MKTIFNPFKKYSEKVLSMLGIIFLIIGSILGNLFNTRFDGVLDLHFTPQIQFWEPFSDNILDVLCLTIFLFLSAKFINGKTRLIDIFATSLVARAPYYLLPLFNINNLVRAATVKLIDPETLQIKTLSWTALFPILVFSFFAFLFFCWYMVLLYQGFKVAAHAKGIKPVFLFIVSILLAEIASKFLIFQIHQL